MRAPTLVCAALAAAAVLTAVPIVANGAISPSKAPATQGPLELLERDCKRSTTIAGTVRLCVFFYRVAAASDGSDATDYAIPWFQVKMAPARGWCATKVQGRFRFTPGMTLRGTAPKRKTLKTPRTKRVTSKLDVKGAREQRIGTVKKPFKLRAGKLVTSGRNRDAGPRLSSVWSGRSKSAVGLAFGAELAFPFPEVQPGYDGRASFRARPC